MTFSRANILGLLDSKIRKNYLNQFHWLFNKTFPHSHNNNVIVDNWFINSSKKQIPDDVVNTVSLGTKFCHPNKHINKKRLVIFNFECTPVLITIFIRCKENN